MTVFMSLLLTFLAFIFIGYPLFKPRSSSAQPVEDEALQELQSKKDTTFAMLKELEFDRESGILTEEDYRELENRYKRRGISILRDIDETKAGKEEEDEIEKQIGALRRKKSTNVDDKVEREVQELRQNGGQYCPQCGLKHKPGDRFCSKCGEKLE